jgi:hypothetical protein
MPSPDPETEFDVALARAGVSVPPDRRPAMMEGFLAWRALRAVLDEPMPRTTASPVNNAEVRGIPGVSGCCEYPRLQGRGPKRAKPLQNPAPVEGGRAA